MGKKSIICPKCGKIGTLVVENRTEKIKKKSNWEKTNWEIWQEFKKQFPQLSDFDLRTKIYRKTNRHIENIPTKKYRRKKNPIFKVAHTIKINGKTKQVRHYLGTNPWGKIEYYVDQNQLYDKINLDNIRQLILDNNGDIKNADHETTNKLIAEVISLKNYLYNYRNSIREGINNSHLCPHCKNYVDISLDHYEFKLIKTPKKLSDPKLSKKKKN